MLFRVKALGGDGSVAYLTVDAESPEAAGRQVRERGLAVVLVRRRAWWSPWSPAGAWGAKGIRGDGVGRPGRFTQVLFAQQFIALLDAGLGTVEALEALSREPRIDGGGVLGKLLVHVRAGLTLSDAMERQPQAFAPLLVATVRASERSGDLKEALRRYADYVARIDALRRKVVSASIYPAVLAVTGLLVLGFLMLYVVPRFSLIYEEVGTDLPWMSRWLMQWGQLLAGHATAMLLGVAAVAAAGVAVAGHPGVRAAIRARVLAIPYLGEAVHVYQLARLYRTMGMLLRSGTPIVAALERVGGLLEPGLQGALAATRRAVAEGQPLADTLAQHGLTTPVGHSMLRVGERSGELGAMMDRVAAHYDDDLARWVDMATRLVEPLLMVLIGVLIGAVVVMLYLPVFELANSLG